MKFMKANVLAIGMILVAFSATEAQAQNLTKTASRSKYTGNSNLGGKMQIYGEMKQRTNLVRIYGRISGYARLVGYTIEAARLEAKSQVYNGKSSNGGAVKVVGFTVYSRYRSYGWGWDWDHTQDFFQKDKTIFVSGVPINLEVRAGGTLYADYNMGASLLGAGLQGNAGIKSWAYAAAGVDFVVYRAGVKAHATLLHHNLQVNSTVTFTKVKGDFIYSCNPITIALKLALDKAKWVRKGWRVKRKWKEVASLTLASWSKGSYSHTLLKW